MLWMLQSKTVWCLQAVGVRGQCTNWSTALTLRVYHSHLWVVLEVFSETKHTTKEALIWRQRLPQQDYGIFGPDMSCFFIFQVVFVSPFEHHSNLLPWKEIGAEVSGTPSVGHSCQSCSSVLASFPGPPSPHPAFCIAFLASFPGLPRFY